MREPPDFIGREPTQVEAMAAVETLLRWIGEDPSREGLKETPARVSRALREMTASTLIDPASVLCTTFRETSDELVVVKGISFSSLCEHHMLPFSGTATVGYLPSDRVVGLSKIPRLVQGYANRLQVQERLTNQIACAIQLVLKPKGVGVMLRAHHSCMGCRGARQPSAEMVTSCMLGVVRESASLRAELLALAE